VNKPKNLKRPSFTPTGEETIAVLMDNVSSMELFAQPDGRYLKVLYDLSLTVPVGVCHGITGEGAFELQLISEIIANVKPHEKGQCSLMEIGMMRQKRRILPHVYYINDQKVLFDHMHVLGYLMFASEHAPGKPEHKQRDWLKLLLRTGLYPFALTYIRSLTPAEYVLVSALIAYGSKAHLVVMDLSRIDVPETLIGPFSALMQELLGAGKTVVLASRSRELVQRACSGASFLIDGTIVTTGSVYSLSTTYDRRVLQIATPERKAAEAALHQTYPALRYQEEADGLSLLAAEQGTAVCSVSTAAEALERAHVPFSSIRLPQPSLEAAYREVKRTL
jgi:ABC-2 type transport system ATP-binding protein